jgi:hypothetical protein
MCCINCDFTREHKKQVNNFPQIAKLSAVFPVEAKLLTDDKLADFSPGKTSQLPV